MDNPIAKLAPQIFGEYPKQFNDLFKKISLNPKDRARIQQLLKEDELL